MTEREALDDALYTLNRDGSVAVATDTYWEPMSTCPRGCKVLLLGAGGVAVCSVYTGDKFWEAWHPMPKRRKEDHE